MKKTSILSISILTLSGIFIGHQAISNASGSPGNLTGSPASNGTTCATSCHTGGTVSGETVTITSDIPSTGFEENTEYTITITANNGGGTLNKAGFEASVEEGGSYQGTLTADMSGTKLVASNNGVSHSTPATLSNGSTTWTFKWNSGMSPDGTVVYAAVNFVNGDGGFTGDVTQTGTLTLNKESISLSENWLEEFAVYPNPANERIVVKAQLLEQNNITIALHDLTGKEIKSLSTSSTLYVQEEIELDNIKSGIYILSLTSGENVSHQKIVIQ